MLMGRQLFWRIYLTLLASLLVAAVLVATLWRVADEGPGRPWEHLPVRFLEATLPPADEPPGTLQAAAERLARAVEGEVTVLSPDRRRLAVAGTDLEHAPEAVEGGWQGERAKHPWRFRLHDGRIVLVRFGVVLRRPPWQVPLAVVLVAIAVGLAALPVVARLTHRLERLRQGMERWGQGELALRVPVGGQDEIAAVARSFNQAAERIQALLDAHRALLANASHELRSPLARLRVAIDLWQDSPTPERRAEITRSLGELDQLIEEILLASRLDHLEPASAGETVDLLALAAEEAARVGASAEGEVVETLGDARLLRRLLRNLLENAIKHGAPPVEVLVGHAADGRPSLVVQDRGPGVAAQERERVFEPFYRPAGRAEAAGGWGLGLALVRQIAVRHGGHVRCEARQGGGSRFVVELAG
jgi:two-component system, OmpR family, sensor kinase